MILRSARESDIPGIMKVRNSVKENILANDTIVTEQDVLNYITEHGKGWVCDSKNEIVGFGIVDIEKGNIWALFVKPEAEGYGCGSALHDLLLNWYFASKENPIWLSTDPHTRAEQFYLSKGWVRSGIRENGEIRFEMTSEVHAQVSNQHEIEKDNEK